MKGEIWKDVKDYEGLYEVSNMGRVRSLERTVRNGRGYRIVPEKILKRLDNGDGYLKVNLYKEGKMNRCLVHRLVATAFLENSEGYKEINHKDENKQNNRADNLEWCSRSYNNTYNGRAKKVGKKVAKKLSKPVFSANKETGLIMYWESANEASRQLGIRQGNITSCCQGKRNSAGGYVWMYADEDDNE